MGPVETILHAVEVALRQVDDREIEAWAEALAPLPRIFVAGDQEGDLVARAFALRLARLGMRAFVPDVAVSPGLCGGDGLVAVSESGAASHLVQMVEEGKGTGAVVFAVTSAPDSKLAALADRTLVIPADATAGAEAPGARFDQAAPLALDAVALALSRGAQGDAGADGARNRS